MIAEIHDLGRLEAFFRTDPLLHLYELGDLDEFFRPHARWWGLSDPAGDLLEVVLLYNPGDLAVLLAFSRDGEAMRTLVEGIRPFLPVRFYAHLTPGVEPALGPGYRLDPHGPHLRMGLIDPSRLAVREPASPRAAALGPDLPGTVATGSGTHASELTTPAIAVLGPSDLPELLALYAAAYPGNWFDPRMLDTGQYLGVRVDGQLGAVAGIHVYSEALGVAALGNIVTRTELRGRGWAGQVTGALCRRLRERVAWIGLNVHAENAAAIACYRKLGFARVADYGEFMVEQLS